MARGDTLHTVQTSEIFRMRGLHAPTRGCQAHGQRTMCAEPIIYDEQAPPDEQTKGVHLTECHVSHYLRGQRPLRRADASGAFIIFRGIYGFVSGTSVFEVIVRGVGGVVYVKELRVVVA